MLPSQPTAADLFDNDTYYGPEMAERMRQQRAEAEQAPAPYPAGDWLAPTPIGGTLSPVKPMTEALLPDALRPLCADVAERMQVPLDFPATASVVCLAGAVGRRAMIQPQANDTTWLVVPNLWGAIVGPPGVMKSPLLRAVSAPLHSIAERWRVEHESALANFAEAQQQAEVRAAAWKQKATAAAKKDAELPPRPDGPIAAPPERRLVLVDATMEVLHQILRDNLAGVLVQRDELTGWLAMLDRAGREGERAFYLSAWSGDTSHTVDRIGRGSIHVSHCCVSMLGGIQPARLRSYLADTLSGGPGDDGLMQRFQITVWPDLNAQWRDVDRPPDGEALAGAERMYERLVRGDPEKPARYTFAPAAQELFRQWRAELEGKVRRDDMHPAVVAHLAKYRSLMPSLALLFALADGERDTVPLRHAKLAAAWCEYLESHARRVYACIVSPALRAAEELSRRLAGGWRAAKGFFSLREVYRNQWSGLTTPAEVRAALEMLADSNWVRPTPLEPEAGPGRRTELWAINPRAKGAR
ncbi:MAG TPA: YfjI family protein [Terriglobales bacterium]|nr:YfjI family protein [Terriglobales bacterium]